MDEREKTFEPGRDPRLLLGYPVQFSFNLVGPGAAGIRKVGSTIPVYDEVTEFQAGDRVMAVRPDEGGYVAFRRGPDKPWQAVSADSLEELGRLLCRVADRARERYALAVEAKESALRQAPPLEEVPGFGGPPEVANGPMTRERLLARIIENMRANGHDDWQQAVCEVVDNQFGLEAAES